MENCETSISKTTFENQKFNKIFWKIIKTVVLFNCVVKLILKYKILTI